MKKALKTKWSEFLYNYMLILKSRYYIGFSVLSLLTNVVDLTGFVERALPQFGMSRIEIIVYFIIIILIIPAILSICKLALRHFKFRQSIYLEGTEIIIKSLALLNRYRSEISNNDDLYKNRLANICEVVKHFFDKYTNSCSAVSIKMFKEPSKAISLDMEVFNLCRDKQSANRRDTEHYNSIKHTVKGNTAFTQITLDLTRQVKNSFFCCKDVLSDTYLTTSIQAYSSNDNLHDLPYRSELVLPILPLDSDNNSVFEVLGFFCIDSNRPYRFNGKYDLTLASCVVDSVYDIMKNYLDQKATKKEIA